MLPDNLIVRANRYLSNIIEQDHRRVKQRVRPMLGFKCFDHATITITGIELVQQIQKGQFDLSIYLLFSRTNTVGLGGSPGCLNNRFEQALPCSQSTFAPQPFFLRCVD